MNQAYLHRFIASENQSADVNKLFELRLSANLTLIKDLFFSLYPEETHTDTLKKLISVLPSLFKTRHQELKLQDIERLAEGNWYQSHQLTGMQLYVDHFNKDLKGLESKIEYFEKLGVNFLHLMPITPRPKGENDGGYAVNSYYKVDKRYGTKKDLLGLTKKMRNKGMFLMLDFVANHTSDEYPWAKKAKSGDKKYQSYYHIYDNRTIPDYFEATLPEVFPNTAPGNFTYDTTMQKWVMTVFNQYQWDLNYSNPEVFIEMLSNLVQLTNLGVDVVRFDALAFMWKKIGTTSQNLPEAHTLISLFKLCLQITSPGVVLLAEAIVAPNEIIKYFGSGILKGNECEIAYNATLMSLLWNSIATKKTKLLYKSLENVPKKPKEATWINYVRCHDDIGLGFEDKYIYELGWDAAEHRRFLLNYYCQNLEWSPAKGEKFMYNPKTGDGRITGSNASLLGLEKAIEQKSKIEMEQSISKILLMHSIILSYGGIPLIYAGDEIGTLNDYSYLTDKNKKDDSRWVNRPKQDWEAVTEIDNPKTYQSKIFYPLEHLIRVRKENPIFTDDNNFELFYNENPHVLIYERTSKSAGGILVICNFNNQTEQLDVLSLGTYGDSNKVKDIISNKTITFTAGRLKLLPYQYFWLKK
jgi:amylosucrase